MDRTSGEVAMAEAPGAARSSPATARGAQNDRLDVLFRAHCAPLLRLAVLLLGDRSEAEEVVQDAFVSLHRHWSGLRDEGAAGAYLRAAVVKGCRSRQRRLVRARASAPKLVVMAAGDSAEEQAVAMDEAARVAAAVQSLPARQREVVIARYYLGLTEAQTAQLLEVGLGSVKRHSHRALAALHRRLEVTS
jgi:RNA polymerase sigma factor (sigma-70 family)